ncbi:MAG: matrixin family metalloprotease, partial [Terriglobia bacterium]
SWSLNPTNSIVFSGPSTPASESQLITVLNTAFSQWSGAQYQGTNVNTLSFTQAADNTNTDYVAGDCVNSIGFTRDFGATGIIAQAVVTSYSSSTPPFTYPCSTAPNTRSCPNEVCISDADVEFNSHYNFYTPSYSSPPKGYFDLQTVAAHEIGHMIGLDHSGLANAMMYPYGDSGIGGVKYALALDDMIGSGVLYTNSAILSMVGGIKGTVTVGGSPAAGAHVVAIDSTTGNVVTDTLTDPRGNYHLSMVTGNYYVLVLPLATDTSGDSNTNGVTSINNYQGWASGYPSATVQTSFTGKYY